MHEKDMVKIPYDDFTELVALNGRVDATLVYLKLNGGYVSGDAIIALLTGDSSCGAE